MAEEKKTEEKKKKPSFLSRLTGLGCGCLVIIMLIAAFLLGTMYGRKLLPWLFEKAHDGIDQVSEKAHDGVYIVDEKIEESSE